MSKAEELADDLEKHWSTQAPLAVAAELRRLAQVEAEHEALLKAISDAEPIAWIWRYANGEEEVVFVSPDFAKQLDPSECDVPSTITPLYTLNGIKK